MLTPKHHFKEVELSYIYTQHSKTQYKIVWIFFSIINTPQQQYFQLLMIFGQTLGPRDFNQCGFLF